MIDGFEAYILFDAPPVFSATDFQEAMTILEPTRVASVTEGADRWIIQLGNVLANITCIDSPMPEVAAVSSVGMADIDEGERKRLMQHKAHCVVRCDEIETEFPTTAMIFLLKVGMALCEADGLALCLPASGICLTQDVLRHYKELNDGGPRAWGVEEAEQGLATYEMYKLWDSLRSEGEPAPLMVGFVPAQIDGTTWFFSAGHSLFGMPELAYNSGSLEDYTVIRQFFRVAFRRYFGRPEDLKPGSRIVINDGVSMTMAALPKQYRDFESSTGTLLVSILETVTQDQDWD